MAFAPAWLPPAAARCCPAAVPMAGRSSPPEPAAATGTALTIERLKHRPDFLHCARGFRRVTPSLSLEVAQTPEKYLKPDCARVGFTATKKTIGGAVERNRAKRRLRAAAQAQLPLYGLPGHDYVLVARGGTLTRPFVELVADLAALLAFAQEKFGQKSES